MAVAVRWTPSFPAVPWFSVPAIFTVQAWTKVLMMWGLLLVISWCYNSLSSGPPPPSSARGNRQHRANAGVHLRRMWTLTADTSFFLSARMLRYSFPGPPSPVPPLAHPTASPSVLPPPALSLSARQPHQYWQCARNGTATALRG